MWFMCKLLNMKNGVLCVEWYDLLCGILLCVLCAFVSRLLRGIAVRVSLVYGMIW
jgi:hypothetical protein